MEDAILEKCTKDNAQILHIYVDVASKEVTITKVAQRALLVEFGDNQYCCAFHKTCFRFINEDCSCLHSYF